MQEIKSKFIIFRKKLFIQLLQLTATLACAFDFHLKTSPQIKAQPKESFFVVRRLHNGAHSKRI